MPNKIKYNINKIKFNNYNINNIIFVFILNLIVVELLQGNAVYSNCNTNSKILNN